MTENPIRKGNEIKVALAGIVKLQALPSSAQRVLSVLNSNVLMVKDVADEIAKDITFASQVLKLINSGFYGFSEPVNSIPHAIVLLGFNAVRTLVTGTSMASMFADSSESLWKHSLACARTCSSLARVLKVDQPEEISVVGLLHDMGKVVLQQYFPDEFKAISDFVRKEDVLWVDAERSVIETTHAEIAGWVLERWNLPDEVVFPIANHHAFSAEKSFARRTAILHLADILVRAADCGSGGDDRLPEIRGEALTLISIKADGMRGIMNSLFVDLDEFMW